MRASRLGRSTLLLIGALALMGNEDSQCSSGRGYKYACECWTPNSGGLTIGTPAPCGSDDEDALSQAVEECSGEVGETCECSCSTGGKSCD
ncbi:MAG TPA: hypothetical protein PKA64_23285 [Myxococcota bacterium]|nr:hypothetical protein [Myxococcota bacterium]